MPGIFKLAFVGTAAFGLVSSAAIDAPKNTHAKRDGPDPSYSYDPNTTKYCSWWIDNDGAIDCSSIPGAWGITMQQWLRWNPSITASCDNFQRDKSYCVETYGEPEPTSTTSKALVTSTSMGTRTTTSSVATTTKTSNGIATPTPTQAQIVDNCDAFYYVKQGDTCANIASANGITTAQFTSWNPSVGSDCSGLWANAYACVSIIGHTPTTTSATSTKPTNGIATPTPTQAQIVDNCDAFYYVKQGDTCANIASANGITTAQFTNWNPSVGSDCSGLWANAYACVSIIGHTPTTTSATSTKPTNGIATPTPTQPGMVDNCDAFYYVKSGETCDKIAAANGITVAQFTTWNKGVGSNCSGMWANAYACVSIVGHIPTPTTTTKGNGVATPTPTQSGMTGNCNKFHYVTSGQTCDTITKKYSISNANFVKWNPAVKSDCTGLWAETYCCVGVM